MEVSKLTIDRVFVGTRSALPAGLAFPLASVSVMPGDTIADLQDRLLEDAIRVLCPEDWQAGQSLKWHGVLRPIVEAAIPGPAAAVADPAAPPPPLSAEPWPLAPDPDAYGERAGWWIVVDGTAERELSDAFPTREIAEREAERINVADPNPEWYRHWFALQGGAS